MPGHLCSECGRMQDENGFCQAGCPNSAEQLDEDDELCVECGEPLEEGICPNCDFENDEEEDNYNEDVV